jgi:heterodisulfide reductase subunit A-like polyferredoxin
MTYDALVVGSGIGGMESALKLGDMGYRVLVVEKEASVGGKMILLSKVFPTLDCASCISTPKMAATIHHPNVTVMTYSEVEDIVRKPDGSFHAKIKQHPRYVDESACTGCRQCEMACNVAVPDQFNSGMVSRRAAYIPFPQAVPKKAVVERAGTSPCSYTCPAGIKAHGYVALVRSGQYEKAFRLILETTPLVGSLGRACYAPCESQCSRGELEGPVAIRQIKRFVADRHYATSATPGVDAEASSGHRVAVVGSGPAGLTAAWQLALRGHEVTVFEAAAEPGGMLRLAIPAYRLPSEVVDDDVSNLTALGVRIVTGTRVESLDDLRAQGFEAILLATGTHGSVPLRVPGEDKPGVISALEFLRKVKLGEAEDLSGRRVVVIGGGNVAIDAARTARRLGTDDLHLVSLEARDQMPAHGFEVEEALAEGVQLRDSWGVLELQGADRVERVRLRRCTSVFDADHRFRPEYDETVQEELDADLVIVAAGMFADTQAFAGDVRLNPNRTVQADPGTLQTGAPDVFAAGDTVTGPSMITRAVGQGRRAAAMIHAFLSGEDFDVEGYERRLEVVDREEVLARQATHSSRPPLTVQTVIDAAPVGFAELEAGLTEEEAVAATGRCLDCGVCSECHACVDVCPANAIDLSMTERIVEEDVGTVVVSTGFSLFPADLKPQYGYGRYANVITGMQMDRLLAPTRPYNTVLRPGDGKVPDRIAYVMCTGSRDETVGNPLCSKVCCMYSIKQNQLIMGALPLADVTVHYIDIRAVGKGYDEFYRQASGMGAQFVKGRVAKITEVDGGNLLLTHEDVDNGGGMVTAEYDLVVLAVGIRPGLDPHRLFSGESLAQDEHFYVAEVDEDLHPARTSIPGVFVAGAVSGPKDIPESILHAGAAAAQAGAHLERLVTATNGSTGPKGSAGQNGRADSMRKAGVPV